MKLSSLPLLRCPYCGGELVFEGQPDGDRLLFGLLVCQQCQRRFPIKAGIPNFITNDELSGLNRKYARLYNLISPFYDANFFIANYVRRQFFPAGEEKSRREIVDRLEIAPGNRILETGIGTGANIPYLLAAANDLEIFGLDIAPRMLQQCKRRQQTWGVELELFLAKSETLPYKDETFDVVFHVGGINAFSGKEQAITEMIRVAKPGTRLVIVDEVEEVATSASLLSRLGVFLFFGRHLSNAIYSFRSDEMLELIPAAMTEVAQRTIWEGKGYLLEFRKP
jgi:ubiquinone/menaquinone biosynthesis C-methylase UbiE